MPRSFFTSLRVRLLLILFIAAGPILTLMLYSCLEQRRQATARTEREITQMVYSAFTDQDQVITGTRQLLTTIAHFPGVREGSVAHRSAILSDLVALHHEYVDLYSLNGQGEVTGSALPTEGSSLREVDFALFRRVVSTKEFTISSYRIHRPSGRAVVEFGYPLLDASGQVEAVFCAAVDLEWLNRVAKTLLYHPTAGLPEGSVFSVRDRNGVFLIRHPDSEKWVGKCLPHAPLLAAMRDGEDGGIVQCAGVDGVERLYAFAPLIGGRRAEVVVSIGIPVDKVCGEANRAFLYNVLILGMIAAMALFLAWASIDTFVMRRMNALLALTRNVGIDAKSDDLQRVPKSTEMGEFDELTRTFDDIATSLAERTNQLAQAESKYRALVEQIPAIIYTASFNETGSTLYVSPQVEKLLGFTPEEWIADQELWNRRIHPEDRSVVFKALKRQAKNGFKAEYRLIARNGHELWVRDEAILVCDEGGIPRVLQGVITDISEQKQILQAYERLSHQHELILNSAAEGIVGLDDRGRCTFANRAAVNMLGWPLDELVGRAFHDVAHGAVAGAHTEEEDCQVCALHRSGSVHCIEQQTILSRDGARIVVEYLSSPILEKGERVGAVILLRDITERIRSEAERILLATAIERAEESFTITDRAGVIQYVNPTFERMSGYTGEEVLGRHFMALESGVRDARFQASLQESLSQGKIWRGRMSHSGKDGRRYEVEATFSPILDAHGQRVNYVIVKRDITHEATLERQLRQVQKMEAIGTLAGGIAHDFNNILTAIIGYTELALTRLPEEHNVRGDLSQVLKAGNRARDLIRQILTFSRYQDEGSPRGIVQVSALIKETIHFLRASLPTTIEIRPSIEERSGAVLADATQIHQILLNLCSNAAHAMAEKGGILEVQLSEVEFTLEDVAGLPQMEPGPYVRLSVRDSGHGMGKETLERIFDPFFTTKQQGEGTGMGLAVVHGIVQTLGGMVTANSDVGRGSAFDVYLPRSEVHQPVRGEAPETIPRGNECVLVVDDEEKLALMLKELLERLGYRVEAKESSLEALEVFKADPDAFDVIVTDQTMPQMTGAEFAAEILSIAPRMPIVLCTGYSEMIDCDKAKAMGIREFIMKPINMREIALALRRALNGSTAAPPSSPTG